jgi:UDP-N-acetylglucosamine 1-carboxyvinyltransferase
MHIINGPTKLSGEVCVSGAKNSLLPLICASILVDKSTLFNAPDIRDANILLKILGRKGVYSESSGDKVSIDSSKIVQSEHIEIFGEDVSKIRYSTILMGALIGRGYKQISLSYPGGCSSFGTRPIDIHLCGFEALGVKVTLSENHLDLFVEGLARTVRHKLRFPSVGATLNLILASAAIEECILENIAIEPEVIDLIEFLSKVGFEFEFLGERILRIKTANYTSSCDVEHRVIPDRIETVSFVVLGGLCSKEKLVIRNANIEHTKLPIQFLQNMGMKISIEGNSITVYRSHELEARNLHVDVYPKIGTDYQPIIASAMIFAEGISEIVDPIYPKRFAYLDELSRLGVSSHHFDGIAKLEGNRSLESTGNFELTCHDLRAGFTLLIFGILNSGQIRLRNSEQISRGYFNFVQKLNGVGAVILEVDSE